MSAMPKEEDRVKRWEMTWNGRTWRDMPGLDHDIQKMNFYLFRTGRLKVEDSQYLGDDGVPRLKTVMPVSFGWMGLVRGLEAQAEREKVEREVRREAVVSCAAMKAWKAGLRERLQGLKVKERGALRQLALTTGVNYDNLLKFCGGLAKLSVEPLKRIEERLAAIEAGSYELPKCGRRKEPVVCPAGHVPFKVYVAAMARREGMKTHSFYAWLQRNPQAMPRVHKVHGKAWFVSISAMPEEVVA